MALAAAVVVVSPVPHKSVVQVVTEVPAMNGQPMAPEAEEAEAEAVNLVVEPVVPAAMAVFMEAVEAVLAGEKTPMNPVEAALRD
jgi:hypothetical protein